MTLIAADAAHCLVIIIFFFFFLFFTFIKLSDSHASPALLALIEPYIESYIQRYNTNCSGSE